MITDNQPYTLDRIFRLGLTIAMIWGLVSLMGYLSDVLIPFAAAFLLAYLINPLVLLIQKKISSRPLAVSMALAAVVLVAVGLLSFLVPLVSQEIGRMGELIGVLFTDAGLKDKAVKSIPQAIVKVLNEFASRQDLRELFESEDMWKFSAMVAQKTLPGVWSVITGTTAFLIQVVGLAVIALYTVFMLMDYQRFADRWPELLPPHWRQPALSFVDQFQMGMKQYFQAQAAVAGIVGGLFALGFFLIGLPLAIILGLFIGLLNMVPYLQIIGLIPAALLAAIHSLDTGTSFWVVLMLTGSVFIVVQIIQDAFLVPRIMGKVTGLSPALILLSLSVWGKLLGLLGLLIALPMTCLLWSYYQRFLANKQTS